MSDVKLPLSRRHLDIAIERLAPRFGPALAKYDLPVKATVAEAVDWANDLIDKISRA